MKNIYLIILLFFGTRSIAQFTKLFDFDDTLTGRHPKGALVSDGTYLFGMTEWGGKYQKGTLFKVLQNGQGFTKMLTFKHDTVRGTSPVGSLTYDGSYLYGLTPYGGLYNKGTLFKILPNGSGYGKLLDFNGDSLLGRRPDGSLIYDGTFFYATTWGGGTNNYGTVFKILPSGNGHTKLLDFANDSMHGYAPNHDVVSDGTYLYGVNYNGGLKGWGVLYKVGINGTGYTKLLDFTGPANGKYPNGSLMYDGTYLYGTTLIGGNYNKGVVFKIKPDGTGFVKLGDFNGTATGSSPIGKLVSDGTYLYGMTAGGGNGSGFGVIYRIMPNGTAFDTLMSFNSATGDNPYGSLILEGNCLYGMTRVGGANNDGTIFSYCLSTFGIQLGSDNSNFLRVYPNPTSGVFTVESGQVKNSTIELYDVTGRCLLNESFKGKKHVDVSDQKEGIYTLIIRSDLETRFDKVVITR